MLFRLHYKINKKTRIKKIIREFFKSININLLFKENSSYFRILLAQHQQEVYPY